MLSPLSARMRVAGGRDYPRNWVGGVPHLVSPHSKPAASGPRVRPEIRWLLAPPAEPSVGAPGDTPPYLISRVITRQAVPHRVSFSDLHHRHSVDRSQRPGHLNARQRSEGR